MCCEAVKGHRQAAGLSVGRRACDFCILGCQLRPHLSETTCILQHSTALVHLVPALWRNAGRGVNLGGNPEGHLKAAAASGQALTKNQKKKLKKKLKKAGAGSQATDSGQLPEASYTDSDGSCGTGERLPKMLLHALQHKAHHCSTY